MAVALRDLIECVELPYRRWMSGYDELDSRLDDELPTNSAWGVVRQHGEGDLVHLLDQFTAGGSDLCAAADEHQLWLSQQRGSVPWKRDLRDPSWAVEELPDFGLSSVARLFCEGVVPPAATDIVDAVQP